VRDLPRDPHFTAESFHQARIERRGFRQKLQRNLLRELQVVGAIDLAHATTSQQTEDAIALAEDDANRKTAVVRMQKVRLKADVTIRWRGCDRASCEIGAAVRADAAFGGDITTARETACGWHLLYTCGAF
jgi:hypothetical protein